jgi:hypothetical protein
MLHAILPASGSALRMRGLPKFLLPCDDQYLSLLERHIESLIELCDTVWVPVRPDLVPLVESLRIKSEKVVILTMTTQSMTETVRRVAELSSGERFVMVMPDTYFLGNLPYGELAESKEPMFLACWNIRPDQYGKLGQVEISGLGLNESRSLDRGFVTKSEDKNPDCRFEYSWGAMSFDREILDYALDTMPHTGYLIPRLLEDNILIGASIIDGQYFDCGTPSEYLSMLKSLEF